MNRYRLQVKPDWFLCETAAQAVAGLARSRGLAQFVHYVTFRQTHADAEGWQLDGVIIPRWEWRTFAEDLEAEGARVLAAGEVKTRDSQEVYILSRKSDENTKIRDGLMDIKTLQAVNADGLEQWRPIMKEQFPLAGDKLVELMTVLKVSPPERVKQSYTYDEFLSDVVGKHPDLVAVDVKKRRHGLTISGATVEFADTKFNGVPMQTICVEHADPDLVMNVVRQLGLEGLDNINYIRAMKRIVGIK